MREPTPRDYDMGDLHVPERRDLRRDALTMSVNKNLIDVTTLLQWAHDAPRPGDKLKHVRQVIAILQDMEAQLRDLDGEAPADAPPGAADVVVF